jgi:2-oxo-4-hydroxy-4-carboxy-5-ureidoimidazoline decarboxylase
MKNALDKINGAAESEMEKDLMTCCHCKSWCRSLIAKRPFKSLEQFKSYASQLWFSLPEQDWLEAFSGHPKIGDLESLKKKFQTTAHLAGSEQGQVSNASDSVIKQLSQLNAEYEKKFGFIFIVCATGKSAEEMLAILGNRLSRSRREELQEAAKQQDLITHLRLEKFLCQP